MQNSTQRCEDLDAISRPAPVHPFANDVDTSAELAGVSRATLYKEIKTGRIRTFKVGARRLISVDALLNWIRDREAETGQEVEPRPHK